MFYFCGIIILFSLNGLTLAEVDISKICLNRNLGDILPHPDNCSNYIVCDVEAIVQHCERGLHFDAAQRVCNWPHFAKCHQQGLITDDIIPDETIPDETIPELDDKTALPLIAIEVETGAVVHPMKDYSPNNFMCRHYGAYFLAHPQSCRSYYLCAYGRLHQVRCGQGALWSYKRQQCEISYTAECYHKTKEEESEIAEFEKEFSIPGATTTDGQTTNSFHPTGSYHTATSAETTNVMSSTTFPPTSSGETTTVDGQTTNSFHPTGSYHSATATKTTAAMVSSSSEITKPTSAQEVATTTEGVPTSTFHPTGSIYSATANVTAGSTTLSMISKFPSPTRLPTPLSVFKSSKTPNASNPYFLVCPQGQQRYLAHPKNCNKYFMCIKGMPIQTSCPSGLHWDARKSFCALPKYVKCFQ